MSSEQITQVMKIEGVNIIEYGKIAEHQSSPHTMKNVFIGLLLGLILSMVVVVLRNILDDSIKSSDEIEKYLEISTLSLIPLTEEDSKNSGKKSNKRGKRR